ncbi:MAG: hypothetical protein H6618_00710 [Deltaproteobacteria bacterium]|nr:hypothetical protein [Deltaproteobacteria bacterium]
MSLFSEIKGRFEGYSRVIGERIFGVNNERLDFVMDSFYKLNPSHRNAVLAGIVSLISGFVTLAIFIYYMQVSSLQNELNDTFNALNELKVLKTEVAMESARFDQLIEKVKGKTRSLHFKPFFERLSRQENVPLKSLSDRQPEMDANNPLASRIREVQVDLKISRVSIPKLLDFLISIEKSNHYLRIQNMKITGIYGNKLYFDVDILIRGYKALQ